MKTLACEPGSGSHKNNNVNSEIKSFKDNFHLIGFLRPGDNKEYKRLLVIATPTPIELSSLHEQLQNFGSFCPKKLSTFCLHCINNHCNTKSFIGKEKLKISSNIEKEKSAIYDQPEILLIPVDEMCGGITIENCVRLDGKNFTSGESDNFHLPAISISQEERSAFLDLMKEFTNNFVSTRSENAEQENGKESKQIESFKGDNQKDEISRKLITIRNDKLGSTRERGKMIKARCDKGPIERMNSFCNPQSSDGIHKPNKNNPELGSGLKETGSETENYSPQLIKIELKSDSKMRDKIVKYNSGDQLRLKVTIPEVQHCDYQVEIDLVKSFQCKPVSQNSCRCRQITKKLKRTVVTELKWERAVNISGQKFSLVWIFYKIPDLTDDEVMNETQNGENKEGEFGSPEKPGDKFTVSDCLYELQVRFYENISSPGYEVDPDHNVLAACSSFPLGLIEKATTDTYNNNKNRPTCSVDFLQSFSDVEKQDEKTETMKCFESMPIIKKSLSATEFDV